MQSHTALRPPPCSLVRTTKTKLPPHLLNTPALAIIVATPRPKITQFDTRAVKVEDDGEYAFRVTADSSSKVALSVSGQDIFNDVVAPSRQAAAAATAAASAAAASAAAFPEIVSEKRTGSLHLNAGQLIPLQLRYVVSNRRFPVHPKPRAAEIWLCWVTI